MANKKSVIELVRESGDLGTFKILQGKNLLEQIAELEDLFRLAIEEKNNESIKKITEWILYAVNPEETGQHISKERVNKSTELLRALQPKMLEMKKALVHEFHSLSFADRNWSEVSFLEKKMLNFFAARMLLVTDIINGWWGSVDDKASDGSLYFLLDNLFVDLSDKEEKELLKKADEYIYLPKLFRQTCLIKKGSGHFNKTVFEILFNGWARRADLDEQLFYLSIAGLTSNSKPVEKEFLQSTAEKISALGKEVEILAASFGGENTERAVISRPDASYSVYWQGKGRFSVSYPPMLDAVNVEFKISLPPEKVFNGDEKGYYLLKEIRSIIEYWQKEYHHAVNLEFTIVREGVIEHLYKAKHVLPVK